ncbi:hypothetical protein AUF78_13580 [archaeon 13_1_20CM_2_51_12]|nr:MAG: hypothetical protein AUF78_13580 [archaeon 13_1_20CM_2_51_12]
MVAFGFCDGHISFVSMFPVTEIVQQWFLTEGLIRAEPVSRSLALRAKALRTQVSTSSQVFGKIC